MPVKEHVLLKWTLVALVIIVIVAALILQRNGRVPATAARTLDGAPIDAATLAKNNAAILSADKLSVDGDFPEAALEAKKILADEKEKQNLTPHQLYLARIYLLNTYRATGNHEDALEAVQEMKKTVLDERMPMVMRADTLATLANSAFWFANSDDVMAALFKDPPFSLYWHGDRNLANRNLLVLAYEKYLRTGRIAASLATWYANEVAKNDLIAKKFDEQTRTQYISETKRYLSESKVLADEELKADSTYRNSTRYIGYLYQRAFAIGVLASIGEMKRVDYEEAFAAFHAEAARGVSVLSLQNTPYAHTLEAQFEKNLGGSKTVIQDHLRAALRAIYSDTNPQSNDMVVYIRDKAKDTDGGYKWYAIQNMRKELKEFDVFVDTVERTGKP